MFTMFFPILRNGGVKAQSWFLFVVCNISAILFKNLIFARSNGVRPLLSFITLSAPKNKRCLIIVTLPNLQLLII